MKNLTTIFKLLTSLIFVQLTMSYTYSFEEVENKYHQDCLYNKTLVESYYDKRSTYEIDCHVNYHHYNARSFERFYKDSATKVRISNFNMWHPGKSNTNLKTIS